MVSEKVSAVFLDIKKAFETFDHEILLEKLFCTGKRGNAKLWCESYLSSQQG